MNKLAKKLLFWGGALVIAFVFCKNKSLWIVLVWVFAWGGFVRLINGFIRGWNGRRKKSEESAGLTDRVRVGDRVKQGQEIGRCGHSGNSTEPHLHFQFQDGKSLYFNNGLPVKFSGFRWRNGEQESFVGQDYISKNIFVETGE